VDYFEPVGTPIPNAELKVVDEDSRDVSHVPDVKDETCVRGPIVAKGYFENEKANRESNVLHLNTANAGWTIIF
jgi:long-subunit acyl-CoA synthetase (AMP-forming)